MYELSLRFRAVAASPKEPVLVQSRAPLWTDVDRPFYKAGAVLLFPDWDPRVRLESMPALST